MCGRGASLPSLSPLLLLLLLVIHDNRVTAGGGVRVAKEGREMTEGRERRREEGRQVERII